MRNSDRASISVTKSKVNKKQSFVADDLKHRPNSTETPRKFISPNPPSTAPSNFRSVESSKFTVYEDSNLNDNEPMAKSPTPILEPTQDKENQPSAPASIARATSTRSNSPRQVLKDVTQSAMGDYQNVLGQNFKVLYSPTSKFYSVGKSYKYPFSKEAKASGNYRPTSINLFGVDPRTWATAPSSPIKLPTHVHPSNVSRSMIGFPRRVLPDMQNSPKPIFNEMPQSPMKPFQSPIKMIVDTSSAITTPERKRDIDHISSQDSEPRSYELRPRPTPKPTHFGYNNLGSPIEETILQELSLKPRKKKRSDLKR